MHILLISNLFPPEFVGGAEILCDQVGRALQDRGHVVSVLTSGLLSAADMDHPLHISRRLRLTRPFGTPASDISAVDRWRTHTANYAAARAVFAERGPDLVFAWSQRRLSLGAVRAAYDLGIPTAFTFNDDAMAAYVPRNEARRPRAIARQLAEATLLRPTTLAGLPLTHATAISHHLKRRLIEQGVAARGAQVIYQALELDRFLPKADPGSLHDPLRLLSASSLVPDKGVHTIIDAAHRLAESRRVELTVLGDGVAQYEQALRAQATAGPAVVTFRGRVPHAAMAAAYRDHDVLVFASSANEAFGLTQLEAMASGTTVVSTADGGHGEMLHDGRNALTFPYGDAAALAVRLSQLITAPQLSARLARTARAQVARHFSFDRYIGQLEAFLERAVEDPWHALRPPA